jgi:hypothetical protein
MARWDGHVVLNCSVEGCSKRAKAKGFCNRHYCRFLRWGNPLGVTRSYWGDALAHLERVVSSPLEEKCVFWPFARDGHGYGRLSYKGKVVSAHRLVCIKTHGEPSAEKNDASHSCGNGHLGCVNPQHIRWATHAENMKEASLHGRISAGQRRRRLMEAEYV